MGVDCEKIRNICILAHVDHGKTTLADHLIASHGGGVLHPTQAGNNMFMDYLDEEVEKHITVKSSSIALQFKDQTINLIDSPGHIDFCGEVSTAARLSDGALVLVDAVEGVHTQTHAVLKQAWVEKLKPCLVITKIDRLYNDLKLNPMEAFVRLQNIVHDVNKIFSEYKSEKYFSDVDSLKDGESNEELIEDEEDEFQPREGNVAFASAVHGWGFSIHEFAHLWAKELGANVKALQKSLWGPLYYDREKKMVVGRKAIKGNSKDPHPMFVNFVLEPLWQAYEAVFETYGDKGKLDRVINAIQLSALKDKLQGISCESEIDDKKKGCMLKSVMSKWLPLSECILNMVKRHIHNPITAQTYRIARLLPKKELILKDYSELASDIISEAEHVRKSVELCDSSVEAPCIAFVSKMFAVSAKMLSHKGEGFNSDECFLAFVRVFSGVIHSGQKVFVLSALYDPLKKESMEKHAQEVELQSLYLMMGRDFKPVSSASAGNIVAIQGLGQYISKSATLSSTKNCYPFSGMMFQAAPTLRVAIEPTNPTNLSDMNALKRGLQLLNRADPSVEVSVSSRGEHMLAVAGEVHLWRCLEDLKKRFAKVDFTTSKPLVSFKETIEGDTLSFLDHLNGSTGNNTVEKVTSNGRFHVKVRVIKLPSALTKILEESSGILGDIIEDSYSRRYKSLETATISTLRKRIIDSLEAELENLPNEKNKKYRDLFLEFLHRICYLGPKQVGPNILLAPDSKASNTITSSSGQEGILIHISPDVSRKLGFLKGCCSSKNSEFISKENQSLYAEAEYLKTNIVSGFQVATSAGPLCNEPMWGLAFILEPYLFPDTSQQTDQSFKFCSQVITTVKEACRSCVLQNKPRLVEGMYFCELKTTHEHLGAMDAVLYRRRGKIFKEEMQEGSSLFTVHAYLPVAESFGFSDELKRKTRAVCRPLLVLSHWQVVPADPFFVPKTEEEREEFGDGSSVCANIARKLINDVRRRKGLHVEEKVVKHATKQRTLSRKV